MLIDETVTRLSCSHTNNTPMLIDETVTRLSCLDTNNTPRIIDERPTLVTRTHFNLIGT